MCSYFTGAAPPGGGPQMGSRSHSVGRLVLAVGVLASVAVLLPEPVLGNDDPLAPSITQVKPSMLQMTTARTLRLMIDNMPAVEGTLECVFKAMGKEFITKARRTDQGVSCTTPRNDLLPRVPENEHHYVSILSVRMSNGSFIASTNFTFFQCGTFSTCTDCVSSPFPCDWCVDGHRCTHDTAENCRNDILVTGANRFGPSIRSGPSYCPRTHFIESPEIIVPSGTTKSIKVKIDNIAQFIIQTRFVCQFNVTGRITSVNAALLSDTVYCDSMDFSYTTATPTTKATVNIIWGQSKPLDNPDNIHVLVYKCHLMADNCGTCLTLPEKFNCGWCQSTGKCETADQCSSSAPWLNRNQTCPNTNTGCPEGFFKSQGSTQCFKFLGSEKVSWLEAIDRCASEGFKLAEPNDEVAGSLRNYLSNEYGSVSVWLGSRGNGTQMVWRSNDHAPLSNDSPLFQDGYGPEYPPGVVKTNTCLSLWTINYAHSPYVGANCEANQYIPLCEASNRANVSDSCEGITELREEVSVLKTVINKLEDKINNQDEVLKRIQAHLGL